MLPDCQIPNTPVYGVAAAEAAALAFVPFPTVLVEAPNGRIVETTERFEQDWRRPAKFSHIFELGSLVHPEDRGPLEALLAGNRISETDEPLIVRVPLASGAQKWALVDCAPWPNDLADGTPRLLLQFADITAQKKREAEIATRELRWNSALISSVSGVWDHHYAIGVKYYSPTWRQLRGLKEGDPLPATKEEWLKRLHPDDVDFTLHAMERQEAGDPDYQVFLYRERHADGRWVWIECRGNCVERAPDGRPLRVIGTDTDVTDRIEAEHGLTQMTRRLEMALSLSGVGVFEADLVTGRVHWDERIYEMYGILPSEEIRVGETWESFLHPEDRPRILAAAAAEHDEGRPFAEEYRIVLRDGSERVIRSCTMSYVDQDGHRKTVGANWDITDDVMLQRELDRARRTAEARNAELEAARSSIEYNAMHDYLTDLPNRRYLDTVMAEQAMQARRDGTALGVLHIDLDRFKQINDTLGHGAGDAILRHAAGVLRKSARPGQFVARIGGDEFVLLAPFDGSARKLASLADRLVRLLSEPVLHEGRECRVGASIGIAWMKGGDIDAHQLLLNADMALYRAKKAGRNRHEFYSAETHEQILIAKQTADDILHGIETGQFFPVYQLQFDARSLEISGAETLARWQHPTQGLLAPDTFLSIAEEIGALSVIDDLILERALADQARLLDMGLALPKLSANVSYRRLLDPGLIRKVRKLSLPPGMLSFELLESTFLDNCGDEVMRNLAQLKRLGIDIEIDDFGSGHASIVSLLRLSPNTLKIDRQLIRLLPQSAEQRRLVGSIIEIGKSLNVRVAAEGVESMEHARILRDLGCDVLQGFALAKPLAFGELVPFMLSGAWRETCC
ncbi:PAS domain S-box-containing protein/diguanylate cyclase (GGDEF) domain-containing protein [Rhizobium sp. RU35A]|uniref:sensor domain-containing protein n=1 Tax=Rhizobium sp. RU35A TaxID=1907414 RepID=UPI000955538E|nr:bifunctional diguanylate cyclase/phosphodiesterase [Rhizobium sp. RU35A]SIR00757.1 PAS domain S-box-containing protein/diguanylate cyclase (GGDEF) domain-containing protein [Rhizobium sp. RU35A]